MHSTVYYIYTVLSILSILYTDDVYIIYYKLCWCILYKMSVPDVQKTVSRGSLAFKSIY